jgi:hypothetical protein
MRQLYEEYRARWGNFWAINQARIAGKSEEQIKELVNQLHLNRTAITTSSGA